MTEKLRKCPFCGGETRIRTVINENFVECGKCYARSGAPLGFNISKEQAIKLWNTRAADKNPPLTLEKKEEASMTFEQLKQMDPIEIEDWIARQKGR